mmetsp:Transcript_71351/g.198085  ORF Transcript_71351/g.198085 Transcript_71351/m.198085 type:complete len:229 (-) Transcript_71351:414-1100(-)
MRGWGLNTPNALGLCRLKLKTTTAQRNMSLKRVIGLRSRREAHEAETMALRDVAISHGIEAVEHEGMPQLILGHSVREVSNLYGGFLATCARHLQHPLGRLLAAHGNLASYPPPVDVHALQLQRPLGVQAAAKAHEAVALPWRYVDVCDGVKCQRSQDLIEICGGCADWQVPDFHGKDRAKAADAVSRGRRAAHGLVLGKHRGGISVGQEVGVCVGEHRGGGRNLRQC